MDFHLIIGLILSIAIGLSLGLIGGGGSIITVPVLVYVIGVEAHQAIGMSLAVVGVTSLIGVVLHHRRGTVDFSTGGLFGAAGIPAAYLGAQIKYYFSPQTLLLAFAALMMIVSLLMLVKKQRSDDDHAKSQQSFFKAVAVGVSVGFLTGFLGVGGGFLIVPALVLFGGLIIKNAIGTSLLVIAINCAAGLVGDARHGRFDLRITLLVATFAAAGTIIGTALSHRTSPANLRKGFAMFIMAVALFLIFKETSHFSIHP